MFDISSIRREVDDGFLAAEYIEVPADSKLLSNKKYSLLAHIYWKNLKEKTPQNLMEVMNISAYKAKSLASIFKDEPSSEETVKISRDKVQHFMSVGDDLMFKIYVLMLKRYEIGEKTFSKTDICIGCGYSNSDRSRKMIDDRMERLAQDRYVSFENKGYMIGGNGPRYEIRAVRTI